MTTTNASTSSRAVDAARTRKIPGPVIALPDPNIDLDQDEEWVVVEVDGQWKKIRLHDYGDVFAVPGLYEKWVYEILGCRSPEKICTLLAEQLEEAGVKASTLKVLDLGAGNGYVADELRSIGVEEFVGLDIEPEAKVAAQRDRPGLYDDYVIGDVTDLTDEQRARLASHGFNCLTCVAALGFGDVPTEVFTESFNMIADGGWVAFNIKEDFLDEADTSGFSTLIRKMLKDGTLTLAARERYVHRLSSHNEPLHYEAFIGRKQRDLRPEDLPS